LTFAALVSLGGLLERGDGVHNVESLAERIDLQLLQVVEVQLQQDSTRNLII
jgi:hypothetical protein